MKIATYKVNEYNGGLSDPFTDMEYKYFSTPLAVDAALNSIPKDRNVEHVVAHWHSRLALSIYTSNSNHDQCVVYQVTVQHESDDEEHFLIQTFLDGTICIASSMGYHLVMCSDIAPVSYDIRHHAQRCLLCESSMRHKLSLGSGRKPNSKVKMLR